MTIDKESIYRFLNSRYTGILLPVLIFGFGFSLNYHFAWRMSELNLPDGGLVTDAAWRISQGQVPFEDFGTIQGAGSALLEAVFILIFGNSLLSPIVHVSFVNGMAGVLCFVLLRMLDVGKLPAGLFALFTVIIFYAPLGMAFSVQHGGFYALISLVIAVWCEWKRPAMPFRFIGWIGVGAFIGLSLMSKITAGFYFFALLVFLFVEPRRTFVGKTAAVIIGALLPFAVIVLMADDAGAALQGMWDYIITIPHEYGGHRLKGSLNDALKVYEMTVAPTVLLTFGLSLSGIVLYFSRDLRDAAGGAEDRFTSPNAYFLILVCAGLLQVGAVYVATIHHFQLRTMEQLVFVAAGLAYAGFVQLAKSLPVNTASGANGVSVLIKVLMVSVLFVCGFDAWWNHANSNKHGGFRDTSSAYFARVEIDDALMFPEIEGARFNEHHARWVAERVFTAEDIRKELRKDKAIVTFLKEYDDNVVLRGFELVTYMFAGKPSPLPVISIQPGASSPHHSSPIYQRAVARLKKNFIELDIKAALMSEEEYERYAAFLAENPDVFCSVQSHPYIYEVRFCELESRPDDWPNAMAHLVALDGPFYGDAGVHQ